MAQATAPLFDSTPTRPIGFPSKWYRRCWGDTLGCAGTDRSRVMKRRMVSLIEGNVNSVSQGSPLSIRSVRESRRGVSSTNLAAAQVKRLGQPLWQHGAAVSKKWAIWGSPCQVLIFNNGIFLPSLLSFLSFCSTPAEPILSSRPAGSHSCRAQGSVKDGRRSSRSACGSVSRPLLDRPEHGGRLGARRVAFRLSEQRQDDLRRACQGGAQRSRATSLYSADPTAGSNHDAVMRIGGEAPRRQAHSFPRHRSQGTKAGHCHLGSSWHCISLQSGINAEPVLGSLSCFHQSPFMSLDVGRRLPEPRR